MTKTSNLTAKESPSLRGRGLKLLKNKEKIYCLLVALFTRAWIEIEPTGAKIYNTPVALFTRAWIEISSVPFVYPSTASPSLRGRGLKLLRRESREIPLGRPLYEGVD